MLRRSRDAADGPVGPRREFLAKLRVWYYSMPRGEVQRCRVRVKGARAVNRLGEYRLGTEFIASSDPNSMYDAAPHRFPIEFDAERPSTVAGLCLSRAPAPRRQRRISITAHGANLLSMQ